MSTTHEVRKPLRSQERDETIHSPRRRRVIVALAAVGVVGIAVSATVAVVLGLTRPGYSFVAEPVVALMSGPNAWMQDLNFVVLGVSVVAAAIGLHLAARRNRGGGLGPALLALSGLGPVLAGVTAVAISIPWAGMWSAAGSPQTLSGSLRSCSRRQP
jgi:hypothetical protein